MCGGGSDSSIRQRSVGHALNFRLKQVKVGQPSDTFIKLVPFTWGSISEGAIKKGVRAITTGWGMFQKKKHRLLAKYEYLLNFFVVQLVHTSTVGQYDQ